MFLVRSCLALLFPCLGDLWRHSGDVVWVVGRDVVQVDCLCVFWSAGGYFGPVGGFVVVLLGIVCWSVVLGSGALWLASP